MATVQISAHIRPKEFHSDAAAMADNSGAIREIPTIKLNEFVAQEFSKVSAVECVYTACRENDILYAWIIVSKYELAVRKQIYAIQKKIIEEFPDLAFDFYIIDRLAAGCDAKHLVSEAELAYHRR